MHFLAISLYLPIILVNIGMNSSFTWYPLTHNFVSFFVINFVLLFCSDFITLNLGISVQQCMSVHWKAWEHYASKTHIRTIGKT
jgi:hypothetical protein